MFVDLEGARIHCLTGGAVFDPARPAIMFLHGAGMDGSVWALQTRWFAHHGFAVLAPDLPGHGRSEGACLTSIEAMADWVAGLLTNIGAGETVIVGHSMGSLVALATAHRHSALVRSLVLIGTAAEMKVGPELLAAAQADDPAAVAMVNLWGHGARAGLGGAEIPGLWMAGTGHRLLQQSRPGTLHSDLAACNGFRPVGFADAIAVPTLILQGSRDQMTPLRGARDLAAALPSGQIQAIKDAGHMLMIEEGRLVLSSIAQFIRDSNGAQPKEVKPTATLPVGAPP